MRSPCGVKDVLYSRISLKTSGRKSRACWSDRTSSISYPDASGAVEAPLLHSRALQVYTNTFPTSSRLPDTPIDSALDRHHLEIASIFPGIEEYHSKPQTIEKLLWVANVPAYYTIPPSYGQYA